MTSNYGNRTAPILIFFALGLAGCPELTEGVGAGDETDSGEATTGNTSPSTTSPLPTSSSTTDGTTGSSTDPTSTSTAVTSDATDSTTNPPDSSTTVESESESESESDTSSSGDPPTSEGYGDCVNDRPTDACARDEECFTQGAFGVCAAVCRDVGDCPDAPASGNAAVACMDFDGGDNECVLDCSGGEICPTGMRCFDDRNCMWPNVATACIDQAEMSVPTAVEQSNAGAGDDLDPSCAAGNDEDYVVRFTAPSQATYIFDTQGSSLDTTLTLLEDDCEGTALGCNDDIGGGNGFAALSMNMDVGDVVLAFVDGDNASGNFRLNIREEGYGDCHNQPAAVACLPFETCVGVENMHNVCVEMGDCDTVADCQAGAPVGGTAPIVCENLVGPGGSGDECFLDCSDGAAICPPGMTCVASGNDDLCVFQ